MAFGPPPGPVVAFVYHRPTSLDEALGLLTEHGGEAKVLAGGQSLLPLLAMRLAYPAHLVDIGSVAELDSMTEEPEGGVVVGAGVRHGEVEESEMISTRAPLVAGAMPFIGHRAIRNRGTVCESLAHADPAAELPAVAVVPHGQGHETTLAQVAADELGVPLESVRVRYGDTRVAPFGIIGTGGSRSAAMAGGAVTLAARGLREEIGRIAADLFEASPDDIVVEDGNVYVRGVPARSMKLDQIAAEAKRQDLPAVGDEALRVTRNYDGGEGGWAQSTHVCWVEVDLDTGVVRIPRYVVVEDCGEIINPDHRAASAAHAHPRTGRRDPEGLNLEDLNERLVLDNSSTRHYTFRTVRGVRKGEGGQ